MRIMLVGDLVLDEPNADRFFDASRETLATADCVVGHLETPHTTRGTESVGDIPAPASDPENLKALQNASFTAVSLAGNHIHDRGAEGIEDTRTHLEQLGIRYAGAGKNLAQAREPALWETKGRRIAMLSYNCVGPKAGWAGPSQSGCAYVRVISHYEMENANPGGPPETYTFATPDTVEAMQADIEAARQNADIVLVALHKGVVHTPAHIAMYEQPVARAAIDAGADVVFGHHSHITRGVEIWRGKPIFHGLGNFVTVTKALNVEGNDSPARKAWAIKRKELFGFEPDPNYPLYPFHPESKNAMIGVCDVLDDGTIQPSFIPCWMQPDGAPLPLFGNDKSKEVAAYIQTISEKAKLRTAFKWGASEVAFSASN